MNDSSPRDDIAGSAPFKLGGGRIVSINVSKIRDVPFKGKTVPTGIYKKRVDGPVRISPSGVENDRQADLRCHGGPHKAVYVYGRPGYRHWEGYLGRLLPPGTFGENLTVENLNEDEVRIGDLLICGELVLQVSEPRISCFKLAMTLKEDPGFSKVFLEDGRVGFYARVLHEGRVTEGDWLFHIPAKDASPSIREFVRAAYDPNASLEQLKYARNAKGLSPDWRALIAKRASALMLAKQGKAWPDFKSFTVIRREATALDIASYYLTPVDGSSLPGFMPGQHIAVRTEIPGHGEVTRSYSLSSARPIDNAYRVTVKRSEKPGNPTSAPSMSNHLHDAVFEGAILDVKAPAGRYFVDETNETPLLLLAGGVGITPLYAMFESAARRGCRATLIYAARNEGERCFRRSIEALVDANAGLRAIFYSEEAFSPTFDHNTRLGRLSPQGLADTELDEVDAFVCGPRGFLDAAEDILRGVGLTDDRIHTETFGMRQSKATQKISSDREHKVTFKKSGFTVPWSGEQGTLLDLAEANGLRPPFACRAGTCQSCVTTILSGTLDYLELVDPPSPTETFVCCTVPTSDVVLDL